MSLLSPSSTSPRSPSLEECPGAPDLKALACPVFPPFEFYMDDSVEIPSMSEGTSAENSLDLPSPTPESSSRVLRVLTTSLKRPGPLRGLTYSEATKGRDWIDLVKQGGATPEPLFYPRLPSDNELRLLLDGLNPESSSSLVSHDSAAFDDAADGLPPPCLLDTFSSLSRHANRASHSRNITKRDGKALTEPETPEDDDVFFHHDSQASSRTSLGEGTVSYIVLTTLACPEQLVCLQGMKETNDV
ncbi:hypothetical protein BDM02DRAFT_3110849, partial [Thelephora ganbajun]